MILANGKQYESAFSVVADHLIGHGAKRFPAELMAAVVSGHYGADSEVAL